jgi:hypothetical protein
MKKIKLSLMLLLPALQALSQNWNGTTTPTTTTDWNTSIQLTNTGWGSHQGLLFNAYRSSSMVNGPLTAPGNTKNTFDVGPYSSGAGAILFLGNGGRMDFLIAGNSTGAGTDVNWGAPKLTISRTGVGIGSDDPQGNFEVRKSEVATGQVAEVAQFVIKGENHFDGPNVFSEGRINLGTKSYGNGILKRAAIGFSTAGTWRGGMLNFYTTPDDDSWTPLVRMTINQAGNVGIGTATPDKPLTVKGTIHTNEVLVDMNAPIQGPDYVFEKNYNLLPLSQLEAYIDQNKHLPEVPSAKEMEQNGLNLKEMNLLLLKKVEELTLHLIEQNAKNDSQQKEIDELKSLLKK